MIAFPCPFCHKKLSVKEELAGKKGKCPACGKGVVVPEPRPVPVAPVLPPLAPRGVPDEDSLDLTLPPKEPPQAARAEGTQLPSSPSNATSARSGGEPAHDASLTDFLAPPQAGDELGRLGGFRILKVLGHGGMGVVFLGEDLTLGRRVAIKAMLPHLAGSAAGKERFFREARAAAALEHDHIVPIFHVGEDRGAPFIVMPLLKGEPLDARLQREHKLTIAEVVRLGREIARGLGAAHAAGLVHRDIKPANIWLEQRDEGGGTRYAGRGPGGGSGSSLAPRVKILDFGLARAAAQDAGLTQQGAVIGTPAYMAPEQGRGEPVDARCDLWSLGVVLYRMCTGQLPFQGKDTVSTLLAVAMKDPAPLPQLNAQVPAGLSELVMKLLEKDPARRIARAEAVEAALRDVEEVQQATLVHAGPRLRGQATEDTLTGPQGPRRSVPSARRIRTPLLLALGGGLAAALIAGIFLFWPRPEATVSQGKSAPPGGPEAPGEASLPQRFTNSLGIEFALVPRGKFWMGGGKGKPGSRVEEVPHDFYLGVYEVTQEEWQKVMGKNPSLFARAGPRKKALKDLKDADAVLKRFPVESVSWGECQQFISRLNARLSELGWIYRLPTETEWEYACRGGPSPRPEDYGFDFYLDQPANTLSPDKANFNKNLKRPCQVGSYRPNRLGLYDMHGNVSEWCDAEGGGASVAAYRGGGWNSPAGLCTAAHRHYLASARHDALGLRLARVPVGKDSK